MLLALIAAANAKNDGFAITAQVQQREAAWLNSTPHGKPDSDVTVTTDGGTDNIHVIGATYVVCWWKGSCVGVYFTAHADQAVILRAIQAGEPEAVNSSPATWDDDDLDGDGPDGYEI